MTICMTCGRETDKYAVLNCPNKECQAKIIRCAPCRANENKYVCASCAFSGP